MNCWKISLIDGKRAGAEASSKSGFKKPIIAVTCLLGASLACVVASLRVKSPSSSLKVIELCEQFF